MTDPLDELTDFFRKQFGFPSPEVERAIEALGRLAGGAAPAAEPVAAAAAPPEGFVARLEAIEGRLAKLEAPVASDIAADVHRRLAALEAARATPARAAAPAAKATA